MNSTLAPPRPVSDTKRGRKPKELNGGKAHAKSSGKPSKVKRVEVRIAIEKVENPLTELITPRKATVRWNSTEWADLAERVHRKRAKHADLSIFELCNAVQKQDDWPKDRVRKITTLNDIKQLLPLLQEIDTKLYHTREHELPQLSDRCETFKSQVVDREQLLSNLHPDEVMRRFSDLVLGQYSESLPLSQLFAALGKAVVRLEHKVDQHITEHGKLIVETTAQRPSLATNVKLNGNGHHKPKVVLVGFQQHKMVEIIAHIGNHCEVILASKDANNLPADLDHLVMWEDHTPGNVKQRLNRMYPRHILSHRGDFSTLLATLERRFA
jgi:hypothetical protein